MTPPNGIEIKLEINYTNDFLCQLKHQIITIE